jgi:hypothetical protein
MRPSNSEENSQTNPSNGTRLTRIYKAKARSRITNGRDLLPGIDGRGRWVRRFRDIRALHLSDLGGEYACSEGEKAIVRRAACLVVELERMEMLFAQKGASTPLQFEQYQRGANTLRRLLESIGLQRRPRDVTTLGDLLRADLQQQREAKETQP